MRGVRLVAWLALALAVLFAGAAALVRNQMVAQAESAKAPDQLGQAPNFSLVDQEGEPFSSSDVKGKVWVADFFFSRCQGICPKMKLSLTRVQERYRNNPNVKLVSISIDPERDDSKVLLAYARQWGANFEQWRFLTGDKQKIYDMSRNGFHLDVSVGGPDGLVHSDKLILVDKHGEIRGYYSGTRSDDVEELIEAIAAVLAEN